MSWEDFFNWTNVSFSLTVFFLIFLSFLSVLRFKERIPAVRDRVPQSDQVNVILSFGPAVLPPTQQYGYSCTPVVHLYLCELQVEEVKNLKLITCGGFSVSLGV